MMNPVEWIFATPGAPALGAANCYSQEFPSGTLCPIVGKRVTAKRQARIARRA